MGVRLVLRSALAKAAPPDLSYDFDQARVVIGRGTGADVRIPHRTVSELHATLQLQAGRYVLVDHASTNGTYVGGQRLVPERPKGLESGDTIVFGEFELTFQAGIATAVTTSAERTASLARRMLREVIAPDDEMASPPRLLAVAGPAAGAEIRLVQAPSSVVVGRGETCGWVLDDPDISREHLELIRDLDGVLARDLQSKNGLTFGGRRLSERRLRHGDELIVGNTCLRFEDPAEQALQALVGEEDVRSSATTSMHPVIDAPDATPQPEKSEPASSEPPPPPAPAEPLMRGADAVIYLLAALVLAMSVAGLFLLLRNPPY